MTSLAPLPFCLKEQIDPFFFKYDIIVLVESKKREELKTTMSYIRTPIYVVKSREDEYNCFACPAPPSSFSTTSRMVMADHIRTKHLPNASNKEVWDKEIHAIGRLWIESQ